MNLFASVHSFRSVGTTKIWEGDLRVFFSTQAVGDLTPTPAPGIWTPRQSSVQQTIKLPTGEQLTTHFMLATDNVPSSLYLFPTIQVTDAGGQIFPTNGTRPSQTKGLPPGTATYTAWNGKAHSLNNKFVGEAGSKWLFPLTAYPQTVTGSGGPSGVPRRNVSIAVLRRSSNVARNERPAAWTGRLSGSLSGRLRRRRPKQSRRWQ